MKRIALNLLSRANQGVVKEGAHSPGPINRSAFLYMEPKNGEEEHAQCCECWKWTGHDHETCVVLGKTHIPGTASCNLYEYGRPNPVFAGHEQQVYTPEEAGFVNRPVRCENCVAFMPGPDGERGQCQLFLKLNQAVPEFFNLDTDVYHAGCCNANTAKQNAQTEPQGD